jgi:hypothetical protein
VIQTLVEVATNPDAKDAARLQAVKILGTVTEIAAFTERKETKVVTSSEDARAEIMAELRALSNAQAIDVEAEAASLLDELKEAAQETHHTPTPTIDESDPLVPIHTIPHKQSPPIYDSTIKSGYTLKNPILLTPTLPEGEDPPAGFLAN